MNWKSRPQIKWYAHFATERGIVWGEEFYADHVLTAEAVAGQKARKYGKDVFVVVYRAD